MTSNTVRPVLLVGSVPLKSAEDVFRATASALGTLLSRIPDGETGERTNWVLWQGSRFANAPGLKGISRPESEKFRMPQFRTQPGVKAGNVAFGPLGYAEKAIESYAVFRRLRESGSIPRGTRFQVALPTALAVVFTFVAPDQVRDLWPIYERQLLAELDLIAKAIPPWDLAIQWDIAVEICGILENPVIAPDWPFATLVDAIARAAARVPAGAELGFHLCYGDPGHKHIVEPKDTALMVEVANRISAAVARPIDWIHMPVPRDRSDEGYFVPLRGLGLKTETKLFLGLVHMTDGIDGAQRRLAAAKRVRTDFGIATECGFGRRPAETIPDLLALHRKIAAMCG
jgi:hypothetical protein